MPKLLLTWPSRTSGKQQSTRKRRMADDADVPLYAPAEPRVADGQVRWLKNRSDVQKLSSGGLVHQRPQPPADFKEKCRAQKFVLQYRNPEIPGLTVSRVPVLYCVRQDVGNMAIRHILQHLIRYTGGRCSERHANPVRCEAGEGDFPGRGQPPA